MPVSSLSSSVFKWPDRNQVHRALRKSIDALIKVQPNILKVGYIGSYARGDWGVGSDMDLVVVIEDDDTRFLDRTIPLDLAEIPVPVDVITYNSSEWKEPITRKGKFPDTIRSEIVWILARD